MALYLRSNANVKKKIGGVGLLRFRVILAKLEVDEVLKNEKRNQTFFRRMKSIQISTTKNVLKFLIFFLRLFLIFF
jgi:hypothetical protein